MDDIKDRRGYCQLKEEALDRTMWRNRFGRGFGPVVWQIKVDDICYMSLCLDDLLVCNLDGFPSKTCIPEGHLHRVTYTKCRIDTINSPDDWHIAVRNM